MSGNILPTVSLAGMIWVVSGLCYDDEVCKSIDVLTRGVLGLL